MSQAVMEILDRIRHLPEGERHELDVQLASISEAEWCQEAEQARVLAKERGIDQAAIDDAVAKTRYPR